MPEYQLIKRYHRKLKYDDVVENLQTRPITN